LGDDSSARGACNAARDCGLTIPDNLSIAGFNDTLRIARPDLPGKTITLPAQWVRRESCGSIPAISGNAAEPLGQR
jgi:DNA-binding LacI/PurR family transcriptional regulator